MNHNAISSCDANLFVEYNVIDSVHTQLHTLYNFYRIHALKLVLNQQKNQEDKKGFIT